MSELTKNEKKIEPFKPKNIILNETFFPGLLSLNLSFVCLNTQRVYLTRFFYGKIKMQVSYIKQNNPLKRRQSPSYHPLRYHVEPDVN
jgi:hypothetical protein